MDQKEQSVRSSGPLITGTLPAWVPTRSSGPKALYLPMVASTGVVGLVGVFPKGANRDSIPRHTLSESFVNQTAMAIETGHAGKEVHEEHLRRSTECQNYVPEFRLSRFPAPAGGRGGSSQHPSGKGRFLDRSAVWNCCTQSMRRRADWNASSAMS